MTIEEKLKLQRACEVVAKHAAIAYMEQNLMTANAYELMSAIRRRLPQKLNQASVDAYKSLDVRFSLSEMARENFALTVMAAGVEAAKEVGRTVPISMTNAIKVEIPKNDSLPSELKTKKIIT